jgi:hypothetical protein
VRKLTRRPRAPRYLVVLSETVVVWVIVPLEALIVRVKVLVLLLPVAMLIVEKAEVVPETVTDAGLKLALAPPDNPVTANATDPLNPLDGVTFIVYLVVDPRTTVWDSGATERAKFGLVGGGVMVMEAVADLVESATLVTLTVAPVLTFTVGAV